MSSLKLTKKLVKSAFVTQRERFAKVSNTSDAIGANYGSQFLKYGQGPTETIYDGVTPYALTTTEEYPVHMFNLSTTSANPTARNLNEGRVGWKLGQCTNNAIINRMVWLPLGAWTNTTAGNDELLAPNTNQWGLEDNVNAAYVNVGREGLLLWSQIKCLFYGKKSRPTAIRAQFVQITDPGYCPDYEYTLDGNAFIRIMDNDAMEFWKSYVKPLVANPCSSVTVLKRKSPIKVLSKYDIVLQSKETTNQDSDPNQKFMKWFNRWNRMVNYAYEDVNTQNVADVADPQKWPSLATPYGCSKFPKDLNSSIYFMVTSYQPDRAEDGLAPSIDNTCSYDFNLRKCTGILTA